MLPIFLNVKLGDRLAVDGNITGKRIVESLDELNAR